MNKKESNSESTKKADAIAVKNLAFSYPNSGTTFCIPKLSIAQGERVFLHGPSGSGKTTLLGLLSGVLQASAGDIALLGESLTSKTASQRDRFRGAHLGYIFQMFNLLPYLSVMENITLSCSLNPERLARLGPRSLEQAAMELAESLGLKALLSQSVTTLSVGQQQRVAVARALLGAPEIIIADEPTSALDQDSREAFLKLLFKECEKNQSTLVFVSHDRTLQGLFERNVSIEELKK